MSTRSVTVLPYLRTIQSDYKIILASGSPRRKELLSLMGITNFEVIVSNFPENFDTKSFQHPSEYCLMTARRKVEDVVRTLTHRERENLFIIGADTIVSYEEDILEKPKDYVDAKRMVSSLSGKRHTVYTGVVVFGNGFSSSEAPRPIHHQESFVEASDVIFSDLSELDIDAYIATNEGLDKAGSYGIQGFGSQLVRRVEGCYFNVMGLPVNKLSQTIARLIQQNQAAI